MHPRVAINLGQWISPAFDVKVSRWVTDWMMGRDVPGAFMPEHVRRFLKNRANRWMMPLQDATPSFGGFGLRTRLVVPDWFTITRSRWL